jgi:hypothetical protein
MTYGAGPVTSCTITIDNPGAAGGVHATGKFSAVVTISGADVQITGGTFDTPVTITGG